MRVILIPLGCLTLKLLLVDLIVSEDVRLDITKGADEEHGSLVRLCRGPGSQASIECTTLPLALGRRLGVQWFLDRPRGVQTLRDVHPATATHSCLPMRLPLVAPLGCQVFRGVRFPVDLRQHDLFDEILLLPPVA
jgi:hypothetical protein